ncbi:GNAT family N-acetyltransferase [Sulfobacillus harzensis]|nr:GNAT family protein [Sulfobacillus harzensis]
MVTQFTVWQPNDRSAAERFLQDAMAHTMATRRRTFILGIHHRATGRIIGGARITVQKPEHRLADIGYVLHRQFWNHGLGTEAARLLVQFGFESLHLHRIEATCDPANIGSRRVLEKAGFHLEGHLREHLWVRGRWRDSLIFAVLE